MLGEKQLHSSWIRVPSEKRTKQEILLHPQRTKSSHHMRLSFSRKGITWSLQEIVVLVFAVILLLALLDFSGQIYGALFAGKDDGSKANYDRLVLTIKEMTDPAKTPQFQPNYRIINYFLGEDKILVPFNTNFITN